MRAGVLLAMTIAGSPGTPAAQVAAQSATAPPGISVVDLIELSRIGSREAGGSEADGAVVSPDQKRVATVVQRGLLAENRREFSLLVLSTQEPGDIVPAREYAKFVNSSNRPAISQVTWVSNDRLAFLAEGPDGPPQVYMADIQTRETIQRTHVAEPITMFDVSVGGRVIAYVVERPREPSSALRPLREHGFVIPDAMPISELFDGKWDRVTAMNSDGGLVHVVRDGVETAVPLPDATAYGESEAAGPFASDSFSLAPSGELALIRCRPKRPPRSWALYREKHFRREQSTGARYPWWIVVDLHTGEAWPLTGGPSMNFSAKPLWTADSRSVIVLDDLLPLDGESSTERSQRAAARLTAEVAVRSRAVHLITRRNPIRLERWDAESGTLTLQIAPDRRNANEFVAYRKSTVGWIEERASGRSREGPQIRVDQGLNEPWRLVRASSDNHEKAIVYDPNSELLAGRRRAQESIVRWRTKSGAELSAGLYLPIDYEKGERYPVVIQTHGFEENNFAPDGFSTTGFAAQPLAAAGFVVVQAHRCSKHCDPPKKNRRSEGEFIKDAWQSLVDHLDSLSLIDRSRVALQGYSRSCYHELYFLTHSTYSIAAMICTDGIDGSYFQYLLFGKENPGLADEYRSMNDGPPFGRTLKNWLKSAPGFNLDRIHTPVRLVALNDSASLLEEWEPYAGLTLQGKPVELFYLPDAIHNIVRPWERFASQQGTVDWFRFWLQGYERKSPVTEAEETSASLSAQYARWERLCRLQTASLPAVGRHCAQEP